MTNVQQLSAHVFEEIFTYIDEARELLGINANTSPREVVTTLERWIDNARPTLITTSDNELIHMAIRCGCLWADAVMREYDWTWIEVIREDGVYPAIVSPNKGYIIFPAPLAQSWFIEGDDQPLARALFDNMATMPPVDDGQFVCVENALP